MGDVNFNFKQPVSYFVRHIFQMNSPPSLRLEVGPCKIQLCVNGPLD